MKKHIVFASLTFCVLVSAAFAQTAVKPTPTPAPASDEAAKRALAAISRLANRTDTLNPKARSWVKPTYLWDYHQGDVIIKVTIDAAGNVTKAEALSGENDIAGAAAKAALLAKFEPAVKNGKNVEQIGNVLYTFAAIPDSKDPAAVRRCKEEKFYVCQEPLFDFSNTDFWGDFEKAAKDSPEAEVDKLIVDFDKKFEVLTKWLASKDANASRVSRSVGCSHYDGAKKLLENVYIRLKKMDADKQPPYVKGRAEFDKRLKAFDLVKRPENCTLFV
jgi:hypothetical protein